jgi:hypothetical protein
MKTYEIEITQVDVFRVQALDEDSAIEHARGHKPDAPGCVLEVVRGHVSARAVHVSAPEHDPFAAVNGARTKAPEVNDEQLLARLGLAAFDDIEQYRAALQQIAQDRAVYAPELQNIARQALGMPKL